MFHTTQIPTITQGRTVITLGKFNGVHRGHQKLIRRVRKLANTGLTSVVCAFCTENHALLTSAERVRLMQEFQMDWFIEYTMDKQMMRMEPEEFVKSILVEKLRVAYVVVGPDFRFGHHRKGDVDLLRKMGEILGFSVDVLEKEMTGNRKISSTYIREQLNEGNMEKVNELLGYVFSTEGEVLHGRGLGHRKLLPTTNLVPPREKLMPPNGVYATKSVFQHKEFYGITNVGYKPTVGKEEFLGVETYLFDCDEDLYGQCSTVYFYKYLRPERKFASLEELKEQLNKDIKRGRDFFVEKSHRQTTVDTL